MKKLISILVIIITSLLITREAWSLPDCPFDLWGVLPTNDSWTDCFGKHPIENVNKFDYGEFGTDRAVYYEGEWKNGKWHGQGTILYTDGPINSWGLQSNVTWGAYVGEFINGDITGQGTRVWSSNKGTQNEFFSDPKVTDKYVGAFVNGLRTGQGTYTWGTSGDKYIGEWKNNKMSGQGIYFYADGTIKKGIFINGNLIPENAYASGNIWQCKTGYKKSGNSCIKVQVPENAYASGSGWKCNSGYTQSGNSCIKKTNIPPNAYASGSGWKCKSGYKKVGAGCEKELIEIYKEEALPASSGSGFAITSDGYIVTNYHVIEGCNNVEIIDKGQTIPATVISFDISNDLALLKSDFKPLHIFPLSRKNPYTLMEIYVAGYPFGYDISTPVKITRGIVSSLAGIGNNFSRVQIDAAIQPGNSGGPIINDKGNVVGVAVSKLDLEIMMDSYGVVPEGTNFGIKSNVVINFLESNNINLIDVNTKELSKERLGKTITDGTYYISCLMTMAQIEKMREAKVLFTNLN